MHHVAKWYYLSLHVVLIVSMSSNRSMQGADASYLVLAFQSMLWSIEFKVQTVGVHAGHLNLKAVMSAPARPESGARCRFTAGLLVYLRPLLNHPPTPKKSASPPHRPSPPVLYPAALPSRLRPISFPRSLSTLLVLSHHVPAAQRAAFLSTNFNVQIAKMATPVRSVPLHHAAPSIFPSK